MCEHGRLIGEFGNTLIEDGFSIETHCNAGWLALVDYGSALAPIYAAHNSGKNIFVYVDETRPQPRSKTYSLGAKTRKYTTCNNSRQCRSVLYV